MHLLLAYLSCILLLQFAIAFPIEVAAQDSGKKRSNNQNLQMAISLIDQNEEDSALIYLNNVLAKVYNHEEALKLRARIYHNKGAYEKTVIDYNALIELYPDDREIRYGRGLARQNLSQYNLAIEDYLAALKMPAGETNTAFFKIDSREKLATGISTISSMETDILNNIGLCFYELGNFEQALLYFNEALTNNPKATDVLVNRAKCFEAKGSVELAIQDYQTILENDPEHTLASFNLLQIHKKQQSENEVQHSLDEFIDQNPNIAEGYASRGLYHYGQKEFQKALTDFQSAARLEPSSIDYKFNLALALEKNEKLSLAELQLLEVIELDPSHSAAYFNLANIQYKSAKYEEAISYYTIAHHYNPQNIYILYNRALAYFNNDQVKEACADMKEVLQVDQSLAAEFYGLHCSTP